VNALVVRLARAQSAIAYSTGGYLKIIFAGCCVRMEMST